ncbi:hypothetical protein [Georgenia yuyongxinii]|uniref:Uncharacterized protein n=1 Tax=Georgenia yuyongxinii TaxID=2589797 RepID=A0A552WNR4_9MICO|nr:hypothetical protein [Georgenia yuyongxinii]TRW44406.1 hypothetical protein FJ693_13840 [Georgenia yuyongxinii]
MRVRTDLWRLGAVLAVAACTPLLLALLTGAASLHCVPVGGGWAQAGLRLALLSPDEACPYGSLAVGATAGQALTVVVAVAVPAVLAHLGLLTGVAGVVGAARAVVVALALRLLGAFRSHGPTAVVPAARLAVAHDVVLPDPADTRRSPHRRGPPSPVGALG